MGLRASDTLKEQPVLSIMPYQNIPTVIETLTDRIMGGTQVVCGPLKVAIQ